MDSFNATILRPLELMLEEEKGFTVCDSIVFDKKNIAYVNVSMPFCEVPFLRFNYGPKKKSLNMDTLVKKTGPGYGEYEINPLLSPKIYIMNESFPLYDSSENRVLLGVCPLGYKGSKLDFVEEFFPELAEKYREKLEMEQILNERIRGCEDVRRVNLRYSFDIDIDSDGEKFPRTSRFREELNRLFASGNYSGLVDYIEFFREMGEPLSRQDEDILRRIHERENP